MKALEIGPGRNPVDKIWDTMDMVGKPTYLHDLRELPLPLKSNIYDLVYMSHILEHIPWFQTIDVLKEINRILKHGCTVEIWVPDLRYLVRCYLENRIGDSWLKFNKERDPVTWFNGRLFTYGPGEENWHRAAFDKPYLVRQLKKAGFRHCQELKRPRGYDHGKINLGVAAVK